MKNRRLKSIVLLALLFPCTISIYAQIDYDSLASVYVNNYDTIGYVFFKDEPVLEPGDPIGMYKDLSGDENHDLVLVKEWKDDITEYTHYKYQEYFKDLKVEAAEYIEHALDGQLKYANGMIAQMNAEVSEKAELTEEEALESLMYYLIEEELNYAWQDSLWEAGIKEDTGDSTATYYPNGELMWALDHYGELKWLIPSDRYTLAYRFEITALSPHSHKAYYVNANNGNILREGDLICYNGPANILSPHGTETIDCAWSGPNNGHILKTNDNGRNIHTKKTFWQ